MLDDVGIWAPHADGTDVNSVDRDLKLGVLATGDDKGRIKLFRYTYQEGLGHNRGASSYSGTHQGVEHSRGSAEKGERGREERNARHTPLLSHPLV